MKYLKITLLEPPGQEIVYPAGYQSEIGDFAQDHLYFDELKGDGISSLLLLIPDKDFDAKMIRDNVEEITETDAKALSATYETKTEVIVDEAKLRRLELKSRLSIPLTTEELDAIDPTKPDSVFTTTKILADRVDELKTTEAVLKAKEVKL
jgi:hypothetical protein